MEAGSGKASRSVRQKLPKRKMSWAKARRAAREEEAGTGMQRRWWRRKEASRHDVRGAQKKEQASRRAYSTQR